jgi:hypothetical protein
MDTGIGYAVTQISRKHQYGIRLKYFNNNYNHSRIKAASPQLEAHQGIKPSWPSSNPNRLISSLSCGSHAPCRQLPHTDRDMTPYREPPLPMPLGAACGSPIVELLYAARRAPCHPSLHRVVHRAPLCRLCLPLCFGLYPKFQTNPGIWDTCICV